MLARQHVWLGPEATNFSATCEACLERKDCETYGLAVVTIQVEGTLSLDVDVGFMTCARGHRIVVRRVGLTRKQRRRRSTAATG